MFSSTFGTLFSGSNSGNFGNGFVMLLCKLDFVARIVLYVANSRAGGWLQFILGQAVLFILCFVQGDRWANYDDCMSFEEECKMVVAWWRNKNGKEVLPPKTMFAPNLTLLKKAVLVVRNEGMREFAAKSQSRSRHCVHVSFKCFVRYYIMGYVAFCRCPKRQPYR